MSNGSRQPPRREQTTRSKRERAERAATRLGSSEQLKQRRGNLDNVAFERGMERNAPEQGFAQKSDDAGWEAGVGETAEPAPPPKLQPAPEPQPKRPVVPPPSQTASPPAARQRQTQPTARVSQAPMQPAASRRMPQPLYRDEAFAAPSRSVVTRPLQVPTLPRHSRPRVYDAPEPSLLSLGTLLHPPLWLLGLIAVTCLMVLYILFVQPQQVKMSTYGREPASSSAPLRAEPVVTAPAGEHSLQLIGAPSVDAAKIDQILSDYGSPAAGSGAVWVKKGLEYGIDPGYAVAFFIHESSAGTNPAWAGFKDDGSTTHNVGNIICAGYPTCYGRFRDYPDWETGIDDWYRLIRVEYFDGRGTFTLEQIIPIYAPSFENNVPAYVGSVGALVEQWRAGN